MQVLNTTKLSEIGGCGYINAAEYANIQEIWAMHAYGVAHGWDVDHLRNIRDSAYAAHYTASHN